MSKVLSIILDIKILFFILSLHRYKEFIKKSLFLIFCIYNENVK